MKTRDVLLGGIVGTITLTVTWGDQVKPLNKRVLRLPPVTEFMTTPIGGHHRGTDIRVPDKVEFDVK